MAGFFVPQSPKQQFLIGSLVLSIVAGIGPKLAGSRTMTQPPGTFRVYPSYVVNTGRIRRDVNPGPKPAKPEPNRIR
jgi:hypothetical protein